MGDVANAKTAPQNSIYTITVNFAFFCDTQMVIKWDYDGAVRSVVFDPFMATNKHGT